METGILSGQGLDPCPDVRTDKKGILRQIVNIRVGSDDSFDCMEYTSDVVSVSITCGMGRGRRALWLRRREVMLVLRTGATHVANQKTP